MRGLVTALFKPKGTFYELLAIVSISAAINVLTSDDLNLGRLFAALLMLVAGTICHFFSTWVEWAYGYAWDKASDDERERKTQHELAVDVAILFYVEGVRRRLSRDLVRLAIAGACAASSVILFLYSRS